ncbi:class I SAM-dependent methyltransferase [Candidatus Woesebacteria bacterium]|nr:class I SAM-dependent methyltransferase [Candidatus Woesebacteria bacterium]
MLKNKCIVCLKVNAPLLFVAKTIPYYSCSHCGHIFSTRVLEKPYEDYQHVEKYEKWREYLGNVFSRRVTDIQKYVENGKALDVGCSLGFFLNVLKAHGFQAEGLEPSADAVKLCKKQGLRVYKGYLGDPLPKSGNYDVVILNHVMEHLKDPRKGCRDIYKYLKPGGVVFIESPNIASIEGILGGKNWRYLYPEEHFSQFSPSSLSYLLTDTGFQLLSCKTYAALFDFSDLKKELLRCLQKDPKRLLFYAWEFPLSALEMLLHRGSAVSCIARKPEKKLKR